VDKEQNTNGNPIELRNEEISAILGHTPNSLVRNGIMVIFGVMLLILGSTFFFSYPDLIHCRVVITSSNPPVHLIAQLSGRMHQLLVTDHQVVKADQMLAVLENPADTKDILILESLLDSIRINDIEPSCMQFLHQHLNLGSLTPYFFELCKTLDEYHDFEAQHKPGETKYRQQQRQFTYQISNALHELSNQLFIWKKNYTFHSPNDGIVAFTNVRVNHQFVTTGESVMCILPLYEEKIIGKMQIPVFGSGKIKQGQEVLIKLDNYPYMEFGVVKGVVASISLVPVKDMYLAEIEFPKGLRSNYGSSIPFNQEMGGVADVIIEDMSLFERFLQPVRSAIKRK
jgi:hypothetical protein